MLFNSHEALWEWPNDLLYLKNRSKAILNESFMSFMTQINMSHMIFDDMALHLLWNRWN
jgi:hypothetical protein